MRLAHFDIKCAFCVSEIGVWGWASVVEKFQVCGDKNRFSLWNFGTAMMKNPQCLQNFLQALRKFLNALQIFEVCAGRVRVGVQAKQNTLGEAEGVRGECEDTRAEVSATQSLLPTGFALR